MGPDHQKMVRRLAGFLSEKWERNYLEVMTFVKARLVFGIGRSMSRCLRAERDRKLETTEIRWESGESLGLFR